MTLNIFIAGQRKATYDVTPDNVQAALIETGKHVHTFREHGRVAVTLDSFDHPNVVYLVSKYPALEPATIPDWENAS